MWYCAVFRKRANHAKSTIMKFMNMRQD
jgi:hypothetical protein